MAKRGELILKARNKETGTLDRLNHWQWNWHCLWIAFLAVVTSIAQPANEARFRGVGGELLPFSQLEEVDEFLKTAKVVSSIPVGSGASGASKVLLEQDGVRAHAIFKDIRIETTHTLPTGTEIPFRDDCIFECAAYALSRMLGLNLVPPTVARSIGGKQGSLQIWIEGAVPDSDRTRLLPAEVGSRKLEEQWAVMAVFDNLIYNDDRNRNNYLYDRQGKLWLIDHTRAFVVSCELPYPSAIAQTDPILLQKLKTLEPERIVERLGPFLRDEQVETLLVRRQLLIEYLEAE